MTERPPVQVHYDEEVDVMYISFGDPVSSKTYEDPNTGLLIRVEPKTEKLTGITIEHYSKRTYND